MLLCLFLSCQNMPPGPWADFVQCTEPNCVEAAVAVKDSLQQNPGPLLIQLAMTHRQDSGQVTRWLDVLRHEVFFEDKYGTPQKRLVMRDALLTAIKPYKNDQQLEEVSTLIINELESLNMGYLLPKKSLPITGTYYWSNQTDSSELQVKAMQETMIRFKLDHILEEVVISRVPNVFEYKIIDNKDTSRLRFTFYKDSVLLKSTGTNKVIAQLIPPTATGRMYRQISVDNPFASTTEAAQAGMLLGHWVSTTDANLELQFKSGLYMETYAGEEKVTTAYQYSTICSFLCSPTLKLPCIDAGPSHYLVYKADGNVLELSGGAAGKRMVFQRK